ncbi:amino acid adenylation domain-containing protein [Kordia algicida OT-1]|uniref:Peptide synthetase n=1 Tax=Kordia algicida OT-1 TaxID=391587 RepID=A9CU06_9FLAO|nr:amino acid adenylation domain-containing protein [Kordia algicida]EDP94166.1 peptide synthetase [Kordia algicida OT-1]
MEKLTEFFYELSVNTEKLASFNTGKTTNEIKENRQKILQSVGITATEDVLNRSKESLQKFIEEQITQTLKTTISGHIKRQMLKHPTKTAIIDGNTEISYKKLMGKVNAIAGELQHRNIPQGSLVAVCMHRSWELVAAIIGVMQAGCTYVPLDPAYPEKRIKYMLAHSKSIAAIVDREKTAKLCEEVQEILQIHTTGNYKSGLVKTTQNNLAYVMYTSGSTGKPKGVAITQKNVVALRQSARKTFNDQELSGMLAAASVCFDTSVLEILGTLSLGGTIILANNALELTQIPAKHKVKTCIMVPSSVQALLSTEKLPEGLQTLVFGGEALKRSLVAQVYAQGTVSRVLNAYGPTEDTVYSTIAEVTRDTENITIGTSVENSRAYILDENLNAVADGTAGELYLAGTKLAHGYLNDDVKTEERFIKIVPSEAIPEDRLYKTGDLCRWAKNGEIEFLGRIDQQVKIRGYRIELEEIETTLETMNAIETAAVVVAEGGIGQKLLVAFVVTEKDEISDTTIKSFLSEKLPKYMIPQMIKYVDELPLLPNDKLDRKKLTELATNTPSKETETLKPLEILTDATHKKKEVVLATIISEIRKILSIPDSEEILPNASFFGLGLDSLTTLEFSSRISTLAGTKIFARTIYEQNTANALTDYIVSGTKNTSENQSDSSLKMFRNTLANFQRNIQVSYPTFQAANADSWNANDKSKLIKEILRSVNDQRRNPYGKVLRTGSAARGVVGDAFNDEEQEAIIWSTNLYFGLNRDPQVIKEATSALQQFGTGMGISASASGMTNQHLDFEKEFADLVGKEDACLFPTGYTANVGAISGILGENDIVVIDQLCHASIVDGARLSGATIRTFKHNNASDLEVVLQSVVSPYRTVLVVLESVYSMGEGTAPVAEIVRMAKKYNALTFVDEAHSFGFYGKNGAGICAAQGATKNVDFLMTTLSKALGSIGGVIAASKEHIGLVKASSRAYIFQASISPADIAAALTSLRFLRANESLREQLWDRTRYMRKRFEEAGYDLGTGDGPIITPHFGDKDTLYAIVQNLYKRGVQTLAVTYPIVEIGRGRLRFICSASHTHADIDKTLEALKEAEKEAKEQMKTGSIKASKHKDFDANLERWTTDFSTFIKHWIDTTSVQIPNLEIVIQVAENIQSNRILIKDGNVFTNHSKEENLPSCLLKLKAANAVTALETFDIQGLLACIFNGTCELNGQVEAFIWFFARFVTYQKKEQEFSNLKSKKSAEAIV